MAKPTSVYTCSQCGDQFSRWLGRCPSCGTFNSLNEEPAVSARPGPAAAGSIRITPINMVDRPEETRFPTGIAELDRVLSGGIVEGSLTLVGGDPGIGKSTLILQICRNIGAVGRSILYVSGEESARQIKLRAERLGVRTPNLYLLAETNMGVIEQAMRSKKPGSGFDVLVIDSIQTMFREELASAPGSVSQVRECTAALMKLGKGGGAAVIIVGHVTKDGAIAGPRVLEHMVDTVLYFEGERNESYRIIRAIKNRFGATNEIGVFEMHDDGLKEIGNPSEYMLAGRPLGVCGSVVTCSVEGTRPILAEVQSLIAATSFPTPRRMATGLDFNRVIMLMAVLEKRAGMQLGGYDSYVNIAGGMRLTEPAADAAVIASIASNYRNKPINPNTIVFGEVGLTGELRAVSMSQKRVLEAERMGFKFCVMPQGNVKGLKKPENMAVYAAANVPQLLELILD